METLHGRTAFVTGAAQGVGLGIARELAWAGVNVAVADIQEDATRAAAAEIARLGVRSLAVSVDVADRASLVAAAETVRAAFGRVHILVNNAGVIIPPKPISQTTEAEWAWTLGVNLYGVINGVAAFLPLIREHGEGGHVVNTASIGGMQVGRDRNTGPYSVSKYGVVAFTESLAHELDGSGIGVSVLCPAAVKTRIFHAADDAYDRELQETGVEPDVIGARVVRAIRNGELYIFTHPASRALVAPRFATILAAFDEPA